ncbi:MAG: hypothetical protein K0R54_2551 [Clostridiaceae bacterium]|jgi:uncharacterized phage-associated protein|nr:hypothetical protein [Clostridiaceae bacterium]
MRSALELSKYIISKCTADHKPISNLQLQKILYYIQGGFYRHFKKPAFHDEITAWRHGPVVEEVYFEYNNYVASKINVNIKNNVPHFYTSSELSLINRIIERLREKSPWELVDMTHRERPWKEAYVFEDKISKKSIEEWFLEHGECVE